MNKSRAPLYQSVLPGMFASIFDPRSSIFNPRSSRWNTIAILAIALVVTSACRQDMHDQPKYKPYRPSSFFDDGLSSRPLVDGTIPRGRLREDPHLYQGRIPGKMVATAGGKFEPAYFDSFPFEVTAKVMHRGRERFDIYCSACHGTVGNGEGMVVKRGLRQPPSYHIDRLRQAPSGYFFDVITHGFGVMPEYADKILPEDRWAIIAYIRALQLSQHATLAEIPMRERERLEAGGHRQ